MFVVMKELVRQKYPRAVYPAYAKAMLQAALSG